MTDTNIKEVSEDVSFNTRSIIDIISYLGEVVQSKKPLEVYRTARGDGKIVIFTASELSPKAYPAVPGSPI